MKYKVLQSIVYNGEIYNPGDIVDMLEENVASLSVDRGLVGKEENITSENTEILTDVGKEKDKKNSKKTATKKD
ncbi:MAG TPA: hypothetical protein VIG61_08975 [Fusobacterium sp.]|uniref:hypothetical protein n=1 Tax=Fusobacterium sp. TaxID=68766 RepID=UPI002F3EBC66